jgi:hypothetical protein
VLENTPLVDSRVAEPTRVAWSVILVLTVTPFVSSVVLAAEAVLANAIRARAAKAATPRILLSFIFFLLGIRRRSAGLFPATIPSNFGIPIKEV